MANGQDPSHRFETSWLLPPWLFFGLRALLGVYVLTARVFIVAWDCTHAERGGCATAGNEFSYFTVLTYWGLGFYFAVAAVHTGTYAWWLGSTQRRKRPGLLGVPDLAPAPVPSPVPAPAPASTLDRLPPLLQTLHGLLYTTVTVFPFVVTVVYWAALYTGPWFPARFDAWTNLSQHALNSAFALLEIVLPRSAPPPWWHLPALIALLALYLALAYITRATKGFYVYGFLDPAAHPGRPGLVAAYVFGIAVGCALVFLLVKAAILLRLRLTERERSPSTAPAAAAADVESTSAQKTAHS